MALKFIAVAVAFIGFAHADTLIVGNKVEHTVSFIDLATGEEVARRKTGRAPHEVAVSPDGKLAVIVSYREQSYTGNTLHVFDVETAEQVRVIDLGDHLGPHGLKWIPGTREVIATTEVSADVVIANVDTGKVTGSVKTDQQGTHMVALSPDTKTAYTGNIGSGSFTVIDLETRTKVQDVNAGSQTEAITVSPDGEEIWVGNNGSRSIMIFDAATFEMKKEIKTEGIPIRVEMNPTGDYVAVSFPRLHKVIILDAKSHEQVAEVLMQTEGGLVPVTMLWSEDGSRLWTATTGGARVVEIDTGDWSLRRTLSAGAGSDGLGYSPLDTQTD